MSSPSSAPSPSPDPGQPAPGADPGPVQVTLADTREPDGTVTIAVTGELTAAARSPLTRLATDVLLSSRPPRLRLDLRGVTFLNSAGLALVVQLHRMLEGRGAELQLVVGSTLVAKPLQLSGLWHRFHVVDKRTGPTT